MLKFDGDSITFTDNTVQITAWTGSIDSDQVTDFDTAVSGLIPITKILAGSNITIVPSGTVYTIGTSGNYSLVGHTHTLSEITDLSNNARIFLLTPSSNNLQSLVNDETGSGLLVFNNSPSLSGTPTAPTAPSGTNTNQIANTAFVRNEIANLIDSAPITLDTLNELAAALGDDPNFATTIINALAGKASLSGSIFTGPVTIPSGTGNFNNLTVNGVDVSVSGHTHEYTDITNWASGVESAVSTLLVEGSYIDLDYNNIADTLTINVTGLQPSGNYSLVGHTHTASNITDFSSAVSGLLPVKDIIAGSGIGVANVSGIYTISSTVTSVPEASSLITTVFNKTGSPIPKMSVVYINGGQGDLPTIQLAIATGDSTSAGTYGLTYENIPNMSSGKVVVMGALTGVNTDPAHGGIAGATEGSVLYLSPTTPGGLTTTKPSAPNHMVVVGNVVRVHQNVGVIEVRIVNGFELEELHNVAVSGVTGGQFLQYNSGSELWIPSSSGNFTTLQVNGYSLNLNSTMNGRLSLSSTEPFDTSDFVESGTLYYHPYDGNTVSLYDVSSSTWKFYTLSGSLSYNLSSIVSGTNYDVFLSYNGSSLQIDIAAWAFHGAGESARFFNLTRQNGILLKSGDLGRRYIGTIRASGSGTTEDSESNRFVYNYYNRLEKILTITDPTDHLYTGDATWRAYNNSTLNRVQYISGMQTEPLKVFLNSAQGLTGSEGSGRGLTAIGLNSTSSPQHTLVNSIWTSVVDGGRSGVSSVINSPIGYNYLHLIQRTTNGTEVIYYNATLVASIPC